MKAINANSNPVVIDDCQGQCAPYRAMLVAPTKTIAGPVPQITKSPRTRRQSVFIHCLVAQAGPGSLSSASPTVLWSPRRVSSKALRASNTRRPDARDARAETAEVKPKAVFQTAGLLLTDLLTLFVMRRTDRYL